MNIAIEYDSQECSVSVDDALHVFIDKHTTMEDIAQAIYDLVAAVMPSGVNVRLEEL